MLYSDNSIKNFHIHVFISAYIFSNVSILVIDWCSDWDCVAHVHYNPSGKDGLNINNEHNIVNSPDTVYT